MIPLFSPNGVEHSLVIPVYIGVFVMTMMTERYGWVFSGLVVSGYLAPILLTYPLSAVSIVVEAAITYRIVRLAFDSAWWKHTHVPPFGRERFLAIVVVGIAVRLIVEELVIPYVVRHAFDGGLAALASSRQSGAIGLVIVPLLANQMWRPGVAGGLVQTGFGTLMVLAALKLLIEPCTNFSLSRLDVLYEDIALDFEESAKAQIMIASGCVLAAYLNVRQGWDFGGILIPPLLAISCYQPLRFVSTIAETMAIVVVGKALLQLPWIGRFTWIGPRLTLYLFSVALLLKITAGWVLWLTVPDWTATDYFGFGYLLSTLLAGKVWSKGIKSTLVPTIYATAATFLLGSVLSWGLTALAPAPAAPAPRALERALPASLEFALLEELSAGVGDTATLAESADTDLVELLLRLRELERRGVAGEELYRSLRDSFGAAAVAWLEGGAAGSDYLLLRGHSAGERARVLWRPGAGPRTMLLAAPARNRLATAAGVAALARILVPKVVVAVDDERRQPGRAPRAGGVEEWLLELYPQRPVVDLQGSDRAAASLLWFGALPAERLSLTELREALAHRGDRGDRGASDDTDRGELRVERLPGDFDARARWFAERVTSGYARFCCGPRESLALLTDTLGAASGREPRDLIAADPSAAGAESTVRLETRLLSLRERAHEVPAASPLRSLGERVMLRDGLLTLLLEEQERVRAGGAPATAALAILAQIVGVHLEWLEESGARFAIVSDRVRGFAFDSVVVFRFGDYSERHVEVPAPFRYLNSARIGMRLFRAGGARVLAIGGIDQDQQSLGALRTSSLFDLVHQAWLERAVASGDTLPLTIQVRGRRGDEMELTADVPATDGVVVPLDELSFFGHAVAPAVATWRPVFAELGWHIGEPPALSREPLSVESASATRYRRFIGVAGICGLWMNASARSGERQRPLSERERMAYRDLGLDSTDASLRQWWRRGGYESVAAPRSAALVSAWTALRRFRDTGHLGALLALAESGAAARLVHDEAVGLSVFWVDDRQSGEVLLFDAGARAANSAAERVRLEDFIDLRRGVCFGRRPS